jgi:hypothetical protein
VTTTASARGWGNPDASDFRENIVKLTVAGTSLHIHRRVELIFHDLLTRVAQRYELIGFPMDDWGYCNRDVRGRPGVKSNHSWGLAVDLNATKNPMTSNPDARHQFYQDIIRPILTLYRGLMEWGGDYNVRKDYMHFEFIGTPAQAAALTLEIRTRNLMAKLDADDLKAIETIVAKYAAIFVVKDPNGTAQFITNGIHKRHLNSVAELTDLAGEVPDKGVVTSATLNAIKNV